MGTAAAVLQSIHTDEWNAGVYGALSVVSNIAINVRNRANVLRIAYSLHKINGQLQTLFDKIHAVAEGTSVPPQSAEPLTEERMREMASDLMRMYRSMERLYAGLQRVGLLNNSLTAGQLLKFRAHADAVLDFADWIETNLNTEEVSAIFDRASGERERGELYDLEQVK